MLSWKQTAETQAHDIMDIFWLKAAAVEVDTHIAVVFSFNSSLDIDRHFPVTTMAATWWHINKL